MTVAGPGRRRRIGVAAVVAWVGCGAGAGAGTSPRGHDVETGPGCFLGSSDPTLRMPDAWEAAAEAAVAEAARSLLGARVRSGERLAPCAGCRGSVTLVETRGVIRGVTVSGWWQDPGGSGRTPGTVWSVACVKGRESEATRLLPGAFRGGGMPGWLRRPKAGCAVGLSGPTLAPDGAVEAAREDARRRLAMGIETEVDAAFIEIGGAAGGPRGTWDFPEARPTRGAEAAVRDGATDGPTWVDEEGRGPLRTRGLAYALACQGESPVAWGMQSGEGGSRTRDHGKGERPRGGGAAQ